MPLFTPSVLELPNMSDIKTQLIRLGNANPELRRHIRPLYAALSRKPRVARMLPSEALGEIPSALKDIAGDIFRAQRQLVTAEDEKPYYDALRRVENAYADLNAEMRTLKGLIRDLK